ncbi:MAG: hypothetical protein C0490_12835 [Marivirga sp.]|nr:hypothetical protein [Marivirga sp.]
MTDWNVQIRIKFVRKRSARAAKKRFHIHALFVLLAGFGTVENDSVTIDFTTACVCSIHKRCGALDAPGDTG